MSEATRKFTEYESTVMVLSKDNERLSAIVDQRSRELNQVNQRLVDMDSMSRNMQDLQSRLTKYASENKILTDEYNALQNNTKKSSIQTSRLDQELSEYKSKFPLLAQENEQLRRRVVELEPNLSQF